MASTSPALHPAQFGVIGLGVMGANLALNVADHDFTVAVWNHTPAKVQEFLARHRGNRRLRGAEALEEFARALAPPRRILLMVKAGDPVDEMLDRLASLLSPGDIVIDGGNSFFRDTQRREAALRPRGVSFIGMGVSGGEEGARYGPSSSNASSSRPSTSTRSSATRLSGFDGTTAFSTAGVSSTACKWYAPHRRAPGRYRCSRATR